MGSLSLEGQGSPASRLINGSPVHPFAKNTLNHKHPEPVWLDRPLALVHLDCPQSHFLLPELMMPPHTFKTNISCPVSGHWEGADGDPASPIHPALAQGVTGRDTLTVKVGRNGSVCQLLNTGQICCVGLDGTRTLSKPQDPCQSQVEEMPYGMEGRVHTRASWTVQGLLGRVTGLQESVSHLTGKIWKVV